MKALLALLFSGAVALAQIMVDPTNALTRQVDLFSTVVTNYAGHAGLTNATRIPVFRGKVNSSNQFVTLQASGSITVTDEGTNIIIGASAGGGDVTTAQLNSASNALRQATRSTAGGSASNAWLGGILFKAVYLTAKTNLNATIATFTNGAQFILDGHTMTNLNDGTRHVWKGRLLAGTNSLRINAGYETVLATGSFTNMATDFEATLELTRTGNVDCLASASILLRQTQGTLTANPAARWGTNRVVSFTNGVPNTNVLQVASNRAGSVSNNFHAVYWEPASQ
jgi:hypothetical protein